MEIRIGTIVIQRGQVPLVRLAGEHDLATEARVRALLAQALVGGSSAIVSLEHVRLLGSSVIGALAAADLVAKRANATLAVVIPERDHPARRSLELTGVIDSLDVYASITAARAGIRRRLAR